jgi:Tfp pilus assembly protein PilP
MLKTQDFIQERLMIRGLRFQSQSLKLNPLLLLALYLIVLVVVGGIGLVGCKKSSPTPAAPPAPPKAAAPQAEAKAPEAEGQPKPISYYAGGRRDPFKPLVVTKEGGEKIKGDPKRAIEVGDLKLVGIVWDKRGFFYALVETPQGIGYTLKPNDQIGINTVVYRITKEAVHFHVKTRAPGGGKGETSEVVLKIRKEE